MNYKLISFLLILFLFSTISFAKEDKIEIEKTVIITGTSTIINNDENKAKDNAITSAKIKALENIINVFLSQDTIEKNSKTLEDTIYKKQKDYIKSYKENDESVKRNTVDGLTNYSIDVELKINITKIYKALKENDDLSKNLRIPKICILAKTTNNLGYNESRLIETIFANKLKEWDFDIIDSTIINLTVGSDNYADNLYDTLIANKVDILIFLDSASTTNNGKSSKSMFTVSFVDTENREAYYTKNFEGNSKKAWFGFVSGRIDQSIKNGLNKLFNEKELNALLYNKWVDIANYETYTLKISNLKMSEGNDFRAKIAEIDPLINNTSQHSLINNQIVFKLKTKTNIDNLITYLENFTYNDKKLNFNTIDKNIIEASLE